MDLGKGPEDKRGNLGVADLAEGLMSAWIATPCEPFEQGNAPANPFPTPSKDADLVVSRSAGIRHRAPQKDYWVALSAPPPEKKLG